MISKDRRIFKELLKCEQLPLYMQDWYLDIVCGVDQWVVYHLIRDDKVVAVWVAPAMQKMSISYAVNTPLTPYSGLHIVDGAVTTADLQELIAVVTSHYQFIEQDLHFRYTDLLPDIAPTKVTYVVGGEVEEAWANIKSDHRRKIRKAEKQLSVSQVDYASFRQLLTASFEERGRSDPYPRELFAKLDEACHHNQCRSIIGAYTADRQLVGAAYFLHDGHYTYYIGGGHIGGYHSMYLLIWSAIRASLLQGKVFDFEGSMIPGVAQFFRGFGAQPVAYHAYRYTSSALVGKLVDLKKRFSW